MKKIHYNKLIRDKIPERIKKSGGQMRIEKLNVKDFEKELIRKVGEEASGLLSTKNKKELTSELADVLDVIDEIKSFKKITSVQIKTAQKAAHNKKGGF